MFRRVLDALYDAAGIAAALCLVAIGVLILLSIVLGIVNFIGILLCGVGIFITLPTALAASFLAYEDHKAALEAAAAEGGVTL